VSLRKAGSAEREQFAVEPADTQVEELDEFARSARTGARVEVDGEVAVKALAVVSAALRSNQEGRPVRTDEVIEEARKAINGR
jgi:predicted dehydrogenase